MTDDQLLLLFWNSQDMALNALALYITIFTGYVGVAYMVGAKLTHLQAVFITIAYIVFSFFMIWGVYAYFNIGQQAADTIKRLVPEYILVGANPAIFIVPLLFVGVIGAIKFMRDIRIDISEK